jgi:hypothetical protein
MLDGLKRTSGHFVVGIIDFGGWVDGRLEAVEESAVVHQRVVDRHLESVVRIQDEPKNGEKASDISYCYGTTLARHSHDTYRFINGKEYRYGIGLICYFYSK